MNVVVVDIADMKSASGGENLVTYALGSCIGMSAYDPVAGAGALLHFMLPDSKLDPKKAIARPYMFADTGIIGMFKTLQRLGCSSKNLVVKVAGGSNIMDPRSTFNIGKRNYLAVKKMLWRFNIILKGEDVGGSLSRNMSVDTASGRVTVRYSGDKEEREI